MRNIRLVIEYDGTDYCGWQFQPGDPTVQQALEEALARIVCHPVKLSGSGRTDSGVHALGQVANFKTDSDVPLRAFVLGLNSLTPRDITVRRADEMEEDFDSRRSARGKTYRYRILSSPVPSAIERRTSWWVNEPLDHAAMWEAAKLIEGEHDFGAFRSSGCEAKHAVRTVSSLTLCREGEVVTLEITGNGFLRNMVRIVAGTLVEVGRAKMTVDEVARALESGERDQAGITAPPQGLTLVEVFYEATAGAQYPSATQMGRFK